jgi:hypothetical protein
LGKHRKPATKKWGRYVTTGVALEAATLFAFAYATDSHVPGASLLAQTSIFVDGTKSITGNEEGVRSTGWPTPSKVGTAERSSMTSS